MKNIGRNPAQKSVLKSEVTPKDFRIMFQTHAMKGEQANVMFLLPISKNILASTTLPDHRPQYTLCDE